MKLGVVIERFGDELTGGGEYHARHVAEALADPQGRGHDVTILTSTARDARRWDDFYPAGPSRDGALNVLRFPVRSRLHRNVHRIAESLRSIAGRSPVDLSLAWSSWGNPYVPSLHDHLREARYDAVFFFTYFYFPSLAGAHVADTFRIGVPLGHDNPFFHNLAVRRMLRAFDAIIVNSEEERSIVEQTAGDLRAPITIAGCGVDPPPSVIGPRPIDAPYVLYLGRWKDGTEVFPEAWRAFRQRHGTAVFTMDDGRRVTGHDVRLVTVGDLDFVGDAGDGWHVVGHVDTADRWAWTKHCEVLVNPSVWESLSLTLLEAWWVGRPVLARSQCLVMQNQVRRARGGETFHDATSFADKLAAMLRDPEARAAWGQSGRAYAQPRYTWDAVMKHYDDVLASDRLRVGERG